MMWTRVAAVLVAGAMVLAAGGVVGDVAFAQKVPADFAYDGGKEGKVSFSHEKHKAAGAEKCTACHTKIFKMKKGGTGPFTMAKMDAGEACGACHNGKEMGGKAVFATSDKAGCAKCHKK